MSAYRNLLARRFRNLRGLPCWLVHGNFGTWLSLYFGRPSVVVREGKPSSSSRFSKRRRAFVEGEFLLWIEMADWEYTEPPRLRIQPTSRQRIRKAAALLQGQVLSAIATRKRPLEVTFHFDEGGALRVWRGADLKPDDPLWHLYLRGRGISLLANGAISGARRGLPKIRAEACEVPI
jgi:hypothetical protein